MQPILFVNRRSDNNIGDRLCDPLRYVRRSFPLGLGLEVHLADGRLPQRARVAAFRRLRDRARAIVIGGGGLLGNEYFRHDIWWWTQGPAPVVLWGAGHNSHDPAAVAEHVPDETDYPELVPFSSIGLRDWGPGFTWVPCASCLHPELDRPADGGGATLFVVHRDLRDDRAALGRMVERAHEPYEIVYNDQSAAEVFGQIRRARQVVTNSFHAIYWATLLKRPVVAIGGGTKVRLLKHAVPTATAATWPEAIRASVIHDRALEECRDATNDFRRHVLRDVVGGRVTLPRRHPVQDPVAERARDFRAMRRPLPAEEPAVVPRIVHFIFGLSPDFGGKPFNIMHYLAVRSVAARFRPDEIRFHYCHLPDNEFFERVRTLLTLCPCELPVSFMGRPLDHFAHRADVLRLRILNEVGGVYLDLDTITVGSLDPILGHPFTIGLQGRPATQGLCNAVMAAAPGGAFGRAWLDRYASFRPDRWDRFSVMLPYLLWRSGKHDVHVEPYDRFHWPTWEDQGLRMMFEEDHRFPGALVHHLWESQSFPRYFRHEPFQDAMRRLRGQRSSYARLAAPYLDSADA